uniref:Secreted protein n=1 Tax=Ixodes ricinus TaxID=34613 RepID=A0A147BTL6_IXORI
MIVFQLLLLAFIELISVEWHMHSGQTKLSTQILHFLLEDITFISRKHFAFEAPVNGIVKDHYQLATHKASFSVPEEKFVP